MLFRSSIEEHLIALGDDRKVNSIIDNSYEVTTLDDFEKVDLYHDYDTSKSNEAVLEKFELIQAGKDLIFQKRYDEASEYFCCLTKHNRENCGSCAPSPARSFFDMGRIRHSRHSASQKSQRDRKSVV